MTTLTGSLSRPPAARPGLRASLEPIAGLLAIYAVINLILPEVATGGWNVYVAQPALWLCLALWCLYSGPVPLRPSRVVVASAILLGLFQLALFALAGLLFGFGQSPYARSLLAIGGNAFYLTSFLLATELVRARLLERAESPLSLLTITLFVGVLALPMSQWQGLAAGEANPFLFSGENLVPAIVESGVASLLVLFGGPWAALSYRLIVEGGEWLAPALPLLTWSQTALTSVAVAAVAVSVLRPVAGTKSTSKHLPGWAISGAFVIAGVIWLNSGLLGVRPAVITGISMEPNLRQGDIVVTRTVAASSLRTGDIIRFDEGGVPVLHRIRQVRRTAGGVVFITQGDNNTFPDAPVAFSAVDGRVILTIPKLGIIPVTVRSWLSR